ncbi:MAG: universal stress protein [Rhodobacteraceae bacterium]|nr:universal stress protein [Paracoccaceae bacterium]
MFDTIMVPVDLRHTPALGKALSVAAEMAKAHNATVNYVGVTSPEPGELGHNPEEFKEKLNQFAAEQASAHGLKVAAHMIIDTDPAADLRHTLTKTVDELGADLVVMATHLPNIGNYIWASHGGHLANHVKASVFLVRG